MNNAKKRLDTLIGRARAHLYKPIGIAEILYHDRVTKDIDLSQKDDYRRASYEWMRAIILKLYEKTTSLNSRYWDQTFDAEILPPEALVKLGKINRKLKGTVEAYIYTLVRNKFSGLESIYDNLVNIHPGKFELEQFLSSFENDPRYSRSIDKAYEIVAYALFSAVTMELKATVTLKVDEELFGVLSDFEDFARLVLGVDREHPEIVQPARLFRVGTANASDAGLDMWANFGPAIQVKHVSLSNEQAGEICDAVQADQVVIVCRHAEADSIMAVLLQMGFSEKIRGVITEVDLIRWYQLGCGDKYQQTLGENLMTAIRREMKLEFPLSSVDRINIFMSERGYDKTTFVEPWKIDESI